MQKCSIHSAFKARATHTHTDSHRHTHLQHLSNISARVCVTNFTQGHYKQLFPALTATLTAPNTAQLRQRAQKCGWHILTQ